MDSHFALAVYNRGEILGRNKKTQGKKEKEKDAGRWKKAVVSRAVAAKGDL